MTPSGDQSGGEPEAGQSLTQMLDALEDAGDENRVTIADVVESLGTRTFAPLLLVPALILVSPLSGVPLVPTILGAFVALVAVQMLAGRKRLWMPGVLLRRGISASRFRRALAVLRPVMTWLDPWLHERLTTFVDRPWRAVPLGLCVLLSATFPALEVVPMLTSVFAASMVLFALGLFLRDGLLVLIGYGVLVSGGLLLGVIF